MGEGRGCRAMKKRKQAAILGDIRANEPPSVGDAKVGVSLMAGKVETAVSSMLDGLQAAHGSVSTMNSLLESMLLSSLHCSLSVENKGNSSQILHLNIQNMSAMSLRGCEAVLCNESRSFVLEEPGKQIHSFDVDPDNCKVISLQWPLRFLEVRATYGLTVLLQIPSPGSGQTLRKEVHGCIRLPEICNFKSWNRLESQRINKEKARDESLPSVALKPTNALRILFQIPAALPMEGIGTEIEGPLSFFNSVYIVSSVSGEDLEVAILFRISNPLADHLIETLSLL